MDLTEKKKHFKQFNLRGLALLVVSGLMAIFVVIANPHPTFALVVLAVLAFAGILHFLRSMVRFADYLEEHNLAGKDD